MLKRSALVGAPHVYHVLVHCALEQPILAAPGQTEALLGLLERVRSAFDARIFGYRIHADRFHLIVRHRADSDPEDLMRARWASLSRGFVPLQRLRARMTSLSGFMQTLLQRFSRDYHRRRPGRGHVWAGRYRACLLADDAALLAAIVYLEDAQLHVSKPLAFSRSGPAGLSGLSLASPPLRIGPGESLFTADESPPGLAPPPEAQTQYWLDRFAANLSHADREAYGRALAIGWALGRPDSLSETLARLSRTGGRGRSRILRDLGDELGLCGVWG